MVIKQIIYRLLILSSAILISGQLWGQSLQVEGIVVSRGGEPLVGASIRILGTTRGVMTDLNGKYRLKAEKGERLEISFIGMKKQVVSVSSAPMRIVLQEDAQLIDEVIVTGYQKIRSRVYTGAATSVKASEVKIDGTADISRMLEGRVPGLSIQNISGSFGSAPRINIRGGASIIGNVQPLWVIDGAVYEDLIPLTLDQLASGDAATLIGSAVAGLNPGDISDIQVLKDASATSIYGARALNGVIVISTKAGRRGAPLRVSYGLELGFRQTPSYREYDLLNSQETMGLYAEMERKGYFGIDRMLYGRRGGIYHQMYRDASTYDSDAGRFLLENTDAGRKAYLQRGERANTDWFAHLFTLRPTMQHSMSISGGGERMATYASVGYYEDFGWSVADKVRRFTANLRSQFYLSPKLEISFSGHGSLRKQEAPGTLPERKNTAIGSYERDFDINPFSYALSTSRTLSPYNLDGSYAYYRNNWASFNILNEYANNSIGISVLDYKLQGELSYKASDALEAKLLFAVRGATTATEHQIHEGSNLIGAMRANDNPIVSAENIYLLHHRDQPHLQPSVPLTDGGIYSKNTTDMTSLLSRLSLEYNKRWGRHDLKAFAFAEIRRTERTSAPFSGYGIQYDRGNQISTQPDVFIKLREQNDAYFGLEERHDRGLTFSGSATYGYDGRYILNAVVNTEGSNASGKHSRSRWLPTWNIGAKWNMDRESWFRNRLFDRLALRMSYGLTAKMNDAAINSVAVYRNEFLQRLDPSERERAMRLLHLENRDLTWEKMYELNFGVDASLLEKRVMINLDLYQRSAFDLIDLVRTSGVGGQYYKYANFGDMRTCGIELGVRTRNIVSGSFSWTTSLTIGAMHQRITRLLNRPNTFDMVAGRGRGNIVGYPRGSLFSFNFQGLNREGLPTFDFGQYPLGGSADANIVGADFADSQYSQSYLIYHGAVEPQITGGLSNVFRYKQWELNIFLTMQAGNKIRLNPTFDPNYADLNVFSKEWLNRWLNPGDELKTNVPTLPSQTLISQMGQERVERAYNTYNYSQERVADGSFVRLKNVSLAYSLPRKVLKRWGLTSLQIKANVSNPFLIYSDRRLNGQDPEFYRSGGVALPTPRQYTFTVNLGF